ncbi:MAG: hypothetical protein ACOYL3_24795 [Desulfuromonadaceae bacterium]
MKRRIFCGVAAAVLAFAVSPAVAADINFTSPISQDEFKSLTREAGAALGYRNLAPAEPLGLTGFDIGVEVSAMGIDENSTYWKAAFGDNAPAYLFVPKIRARKGLPFGIDVGAMYSYVPDSNVKLYGFEVSKALLEGGVALPAVGVRATYTKMTGVDDLGLQTYGVDASISKGFLFITPYAGAGMLRIKSEAKGYLKTIGLSDVSTTVPRYFGGLKITPFPLFSVTAEAEYAEQPVYSLKAAFNF